MRPPRLADPIGEALRGLQLAVEPESQYLRQNQPANRIFETYDEIVDACCDAWNKLIADPERITSIATRTWALQVNVSDVVEMSRRGLSLQPAPERAGRSKASKRAAANPARYVARTTGNEMLEG
jgi:hypothetical protein